MTYSIKQQLSTFAVAIALFISTSSSAHQAEHLATNEQLKPILFNGDIQWQQFKLPVVTLSNTSKEQFKSWDSLSPELIQQISYNVARLLYKNANFAPNLPSLAISLEDMDGVAYKEGGFNGAKIHISAQYLKKYLSEHGAAQAHDELLGLLYHEIAHAYQFDDNNYKNIGPLIEGIADVVRIKAGYVDMQKRKTGGQFDDGYKTTAFFIHWLEQQSNPELLIKLNGALNPNDDTTWQWQDLTLQLNLSVEKSWQAYQQAINNE